MLWPDNLYKNVIWSRNPQLFYIGMGSYMLAQVISDIQGYFVHDVISGKYKLPSDLTLKDEFDK
jgi:trimethylamine monooxygenase